MGIRERSAKRRKRIVAHRAPSFEDAEKWDLAIQRQGDVSTWQNTMPLSLKTT